MVLQMALFLSFLWQCGIPLCICTTSSLFILVDGPLCCFHVLVFINSVTVNLGCIYPFVLWFSLDICPGERSLD